MVLPYDSHDQVTSGVLIEAIARGRPVVATAFPHAVELLGTGAGIVVDHDDPVAHRRRAAADADRPAARRHRWLPSRRGLVPTLGWPAVAERYRDLAAAALCNERAAWYDRIAPDRSSPTCCT